MKDLLAKSKKKAKVAPASKSKTELRVLPVDRALQLQITDLCEVATIIGELAPLVAQRKAAVGEEFFNLWTAEMWKDKKLPDNFKVVVQSDDKPMDDVSANFILKFNLAASTNGVGKKVPKPEDLPPRPGAEDDETLTVQEVIVQMLTAEPVGMTEKQAQKFIDEEVVIRDRLTMAGGSFEKMYYGSDEVQKKIAELIFTYFQTRPKKGAKTNKVTLEAFTDELEDCTLVTKQIITLKGDLGARIYTYCTSLEQLRALCKFLAVTVQVSNFKFGISDEKPRRNERLLEAICKYLVVTEDE